MQYTTKQKIQVLRETSLPLSYVNLSVRLNQLRTGNMRVTCSNGTVSAVFFLSSGWLNSLRGRTITWDCPPFSITQPEFAAWYSRNLSNARPSMLIACKKKWHINIKKKSSNTMCKQSTTWMTTNSWVRYNWHQTYSHILSPYITSLPVSKKYSGTYWRTWSIY